MTSLTTRTDAQALYYFAFGSNMDPQQMATRCPGAPSLGPAYLKDHALSFRGPSQKRGGGVLSVDPEIGATVSGVLYRVQSDHLEALDRFEGAPQWYVRAQVIVRDRQRQRFSATVYRLPSQVTAMEPTAAYLEQVLNACQLHGFDTAPVLRAAARISRSV